LKSLYYLTAQCKCLPITWRSNGRQYWSGCPAFVIVLIIW